MNTETVVEAVKQTDFLDKLGTVALDITNKLIAISPQAAELLLDALQLRAIFDSVFTVLMFVLFSVLSKRAYTWAVKKHIENKYSENPYFFAVLPPVFFWGLSVFSLLETDKYIMAISPQAGLALKAFDAVVN